jgi:hypothetical protein
LGAKETPIDDTGGFEQATKPSQAASRFRTVQVCPKETGRRFVVNCRGTSYHQSLFAKFQETIMKIDGRCHCGSVTFQAEADPETTTICNCTDCQTMSGAPLRAVIITRPGTFVLLSGKPTEYRKTADSGNIRVQGFCPQCGTALYATSIDDESKAYNVRLGTLRQRNELVPRRQIFVRSQQAWVNDLNSIPKFDGPRH